MTNILCNCEIALLDQTVLLKAWQCHLNQHVTRKLSQTARSSWCQTLQLVCFQKQTSLNSDALAIKLQHLEPGHTPDLDDCLAQMWIPRSQLSTVFTWPGLHGKCPIQWIVLWAGSCG